MNNQEAYVRCEDWGRLKDSDPVVLVVGEQQGLSAAVWLSFGLALFVVIAGTLFIKYMFRVNAPRRVASGTPFRTKHSAFDTRHQALDIKHQALGTKH